MAPGKFYPTEGSRDVLDADPEGVVETYCRACPVRANCLAEADDIGIWGGRLPVER